MRPMGHAEDHVRKRSYVITPDDETLMNELRDAVAVIDPVPGRFVDAGRASYGWRTIDAELAELEADSALAGPAGVRSGPDQRLLTFRSPTVAVELEVTGHADRRDLVGQLVPTRGGAPAHGGTVEVRWPGGQSLARTDLVGNFVAKDIPAGPVSVLCRFGDAAPVTTSWVSL